MRKINSLFLLLISMASFAQSFKVNVQYFQPDGKDIWIGPSTYGKEYYNGNKDIVRSKTKKGNTTFLVKKSNDNFYYPFSIQVGALDGFVRETDVIYLQNNQVDLTIGNPSDTLNMDVKYKDENLKITKAISDYKKYFIEIKDENEKLGKEFDNLMLKYGDYNKVPQNDKDQLEAKENQFANEIDQVKFKYIEENPTSFIALWELINVFNRGGVYNERINNLLLKMPMTLRESHPGKVLRANLEKVKLLGEGRVFPTPTLTTIDKKPVKFVLPKAKFVLVDFWFSHCSSCREEMPMMKAIYEKYKDKGFEIIQIASEMSQNIPHLKKSINEDFKLQWINYLDENSKLANKWMIPEFPTKFLLDENGIIIKRNISNDELEDFLAKNLLQ